MNQQQQVEPIRVRIISIGDVCGGKSGLIKRYCNPGRFVSQHIPTIGCDYGLKTTNKTMDDGTSGIYAMSHTPLQSQCKPPLC